MKRTRRSGARRRVAVVTGTRAEYGVLRSTIAAIAGQKSLELQLLVTGMHLLPRFGRTVRDIERDGWPIAARVAMQRGDDSPADQAEGLARGVAGIARFLEQAGTDIVLVLGDRIEALAGALAAVTTGRVLAHVHGGDVAPGDFDDSVRHAITKLAHLHFVATRRSQQRVLKLGEQRRRVFRVGAPGLDELRPVVARLGRRPRVDEALVVFHASGRPAERERRAMEWVLGAVREAGLRRRVILPNTDRGHAGVLEAIDAHLRASGRGEVEVHRSLPRDEYIRRLAAARLLIGNSSSGIIEAPLAGTPAVDVGRRQAGRERGGPGVVHCEENAAAIRRAVQRALRLRLKAGGRTVYGDGRAGERIARLLATMQLDPLRRKQHQV